ncbi:16S rRNA (guanine(527)-N(7))-methyltransferase RsmG [uncultured Jannaschia sp.]|uniref:16S rRNA (guanine(527)-N(7))-methyltransferase RsmG n=1 Tax=uncultured Jannaschia sp. TaxID=293347 RepID=UPI00260F0C34|nr:16S rRNA (guanine(527)-N(7))-methyltransferase RsmG [uncultured Jannaschia sp.]
MLPDFNDRNVSRETTEKLILYTKLLERWNKHINLIGSGTTDKIWDRHIVDGLNVIRASKTKRSWYDIGSGGGIPGVIVAVILGKTRSVSLVESDGRKCAFLRNVRRELGIDFAVINDRVENLSVDNAGTISARALAPLWKLLEMTGEIRTERTEFLFFKGRNWAEEVGTARQGWEFALEMLPSPTAEVPILRLTNVRQKQNAS